MELKAVATWGGGLPVRDHRRQVSRMGSASAAAPKSVLCAKLLDDGVRPMQSSSVEVGNGGAEAVKLKRSQDLNSLPKPLSETDLSASSRGSNMRVAYQGLPGAFSEAAAIKAYPQCETVPCEQFEVAFKAVELWLVDKAVLPIENSLGGSIHRNYDLLLYHRLHIVGEVQLAVDHCLMALPGVRKEELKRVLSHPQALAQCEIALSKLNVIRESVYDTAGAAQIVSTKGLRDAGAVASARAAGIYGLNILEERIQDIPDNVTRFLILAREPIISRKDRPFKTSIVFTLEEGPGVMFKALGVFSLRNINLSKIESRPQRNRPLRVVDDSNHGSAKRWCFCLSKEKKGGVFLHRAASREEGTSTIFSILILRHQWPRFAHKMLWHIYRNLHHSFESLAHTPCIRPHRSPSYHRSFLHPTPKDNR